MLSSYFFDLVDFSLVSNLSSDLILLKRQFALSVRLSSKEDTCLLERAFLLILDLILLPLSGENNTPIVAPVRRPNTIALRPFLAISKKISYLTQLYQNKGLINRGKD